MRKELEMNYRNRFFYSLAALFTLISFQNCGSPWSTATIESRAGTESKQAGANSFGETRDRSAESASGSKDPLLANFNSSNETESEQSTDTKSNIGSESNNNGSGTGAPNGTSPSINSSESGPGSNSVNSSLPVDDRDMSFLASSGATSIKVSDYFPQPEMGQIRINEFSSKINGQSIVVGVQRYYKSQDGANFYLEDLVLNYDRNQLFWYDTWIYHIDSSNNKVLETKDNFSEVTPAGNPTGKFQTYTVQTESPLDHGSTLHKGQLYKTLAIINQYSANGTYYGTSHNEYSIWLQDIKSNVTLAGLNIKNVAMQAEQQYDVCKTGNCQSHTSRYRYYFAPKQTDNEPALGIVAMQFFTEDWKPLLHGFKVLTKTCMANSQLQIRCP